MRITLYMGKGGVGKTSVAASTALRCADLGYRTLAMSTDVAHSLSDSFDLPIGAEPTFLAPNLWGQETEIYKTVNEKWGTIQEWLTTIFAWRGLGEVVAEEMAILPGMEELANLLYIVEYAESGQYDSIVVDCAPTGETLRLLSFPEMLNWWMKRLFPIERRVTKLVRPIVKPLLDLPIPDEKVFDAIQDLFPQLNKMRTLLTDSDITSMRLVLNPEKMVIKETQRAFTYLNLYGYSTDLIICNRFIPESVTDHYFDYWKTNQARYYQTVEERFAPLPVFTIPLMEQEVVGLDMLKLMANNLYQGRDPTEFFYHGKALQIEKRKGQQTMSFDLPFTSKEEISLVKNGDELIVHIGTYQRNITLPRRLARLPIKGAKFEDNKLVISFSDTTQ